MTVVGGVPAIRFGVWLPHELQFEVVPDSLLTDAQRAHFGRIDVALSAMAYFPRLTFATNLQGATLSRVYLCDHDSATFAAHCLRAARVIPDTPAGQNYLEVETRYEDGTTLTTVNAELSSVFDRMPHQVKQKCVGVGDPSLLKARHDRKAAELAARQPRSPHGVDPLEEFREFHRRFCDFQVARGLLVPVNAAGRHHPTIRTALRGVANFYNPMADNFTPGRLMAAVLAGAGLPLIAAWLVDLQAAGRPEGFPFIAFPPAQRVAFLGSMWLMAGGAVGWIFSSKQMIWAAILGYISLRLTHGSASVLAAVVMAMAAEAASRIRLKRAVLV
jgi:hypothetical protein